MIGSLTNKLCRIATMTYTINTQTMNMASSLPHPKPSLHFHCGRRPLGSRSKLMPAHNSSCLPCGVLFSLVRSHRWPLKSVQSPLSLVRSPWMQDWTRFAPPSSGVSSNTRTACCIRKITIRGQADSSTSSFLPQFSEVKVTRETNFGKFCTCAWVGYFVVAKHLNQLHCVVCPRI